MSVVIKRGERVYLSKPRFRPGEWVIARCAYTGRPSRGVVLCASDDIAEWQEGKWHRCYIVNVFGSTGLFREDKLVRSAAQQLVDQCKKGKL